MRTSLPAALPLVGALSLMASACDGTGDPIAGDAQPSPVTALSPAVIDKAQTVVRLADFAPVGTSTLVRTENGVNYRVETTDLTPGHTYTLWIIIFNDTEGCTDGGSTGTFCGPNDVVNPDAMPDMMYAGGHVVGGETAVFSGRRSLRDSSGSINSPVGMPAYGLLDPYGAEIHFAVHDHGPKLSAYMPDMIQTVAGGCTDAGIPVAGVPSPWNDYTGPELGLRGPNTCETIQAVIHQP